MIEELKRVRVPKVYAVIVDQIQELIETGVLSPGDKLPTERVLAEQLGVSRSTVREALAALEVLGIVDSRPGLGNYIATAWPQAIPREAYEALIAKGGTVEIVEARLLIEPEIAALTAQRRTNEDLHSMQACLIEMEQALKQGTDSWQPDWGFHTVIAEASQNPLVLAIVELLGERMAGSLWQLMRKHNFSHNPSRPMHYLKQHRLIWDAIRTGDPEGARSRMREHLATIAADLADANSQRAGCDRG